MRYVVPRGGSAEEFVGGCWRSVVFVWAVKVSGEVSGWCACERCVHTDVDVLGGVPSVVGCVFYIVLGFAPALDGPVIEETGRGEDGGVSRLFLSAGYGYQRGRSLEVGVFSC